MAYIDCYNASQDAVLNQRVRVALALYASTVATESTTTLNHTARVALIGSVMNNVAQFADLFTVVITANGITTASTDPEILDAVSTAWTNFAGNI